MISFKSAGGDGIISDFYQLYWEAIEKEFCEVVNEVFHNSELSDAQYNVITLLHNGGDRDNIRDWRPITSLNTDYRIISRLIAIRTKPVLRKLIHSDQKDSLKGGSQ